MSIVRDRMEIRLHYARAGLILRVLPSNTVHFAPRPALASYT